MSTAKLPDNPEANPHVKVVFDDIRATHMSDFMNDVSLAVIFPGPAHQVACKTVQLNTLLQSVSASPDRAVLCEGG